MAFSQYTEEQAKEIRRLMSEGFKYPEAVRMALGVSSLGKFGFGGVIREQEMLRARKELAPSQTYLGREGPITQRRIVPGRPAKVETVKDMLIRHIGTVLMRKEPMVTLYTAPRELTQEGMVQALGITRPHIAGELADLVRAGFVSEPTRRHPVPDGRARFTYELTPKGWERFWGLSLA